MIPVTSFAGRKVALFGLGGSGKASASALLAGGADVVAFAREASDLLGVAFDEAMVEVVAGHAGPAYGVPHEATIEAIRLAGRLEALPLDPVYSGKALAGLIALIRQGRWRKDEDVVFLHTGGAPALFAYQSALGI